MLKIPIEKPEPDFDYLIKVISGLEKPNKVLSAELLIDEEVKQFIIENYFKEINYLPPVTLWGGGSKSEINSKEKIKTYELYYKNVIDFYYRMGYSLYSDMNFIINFEALNTLILETKDTSSLSKGNRYWAAEGGGVIKSWDDFERFPWKDARSLIVEYESNMKYLEKIIPDGMKIAVVGSLFEEVLEWILGYEGFFYMIYDKPDLVEAIFNEVGLIMYDFYNLTITNNIVGCIWHADDFGYKSGSMVSTEHLNKWLFPWLKKYASIAHEHKKPFFLHSCGNKNDEIMNILIDVVKIDAIHAFEDASYPVIEAKEKWGDRIGMIGGIDIDKLARLDEISLRDYIKNILNLCVPNGRYVCGSGNSVCNYIPIKNYLIMLDEALNWK